METYGKKTLKERLQSGIEKVKQIKQHHELNQQIAQERRDERLEKDLAFEKERQGRLRKQSSLMNLRESNQRTTQRVNPNPFGNMLGGLQPAKGNGAFDIFGGGGKSKGSNPFAFDLGVSPGSMFGGGSSGGGHRKHHKRKVRHVHHKHRKPRYVMVRL